MSRKLEAGTPIKIIPRYAFETPCIGETGKIVKLTEPRMMALVRLDEDLNGQPRTFWVEELQALAPLLKEST